MIGKTVVIFNAPPNAGKDVSADYMHNYFQSGQRLSFKEALYEDTAEYFGIDVGDLIEYHSDRKFKERASEMFPKYQSESIKQYLFSILYVIGALIGNKYLMSLGYYSSREALIHVSEEVVKPVLGKNYYGLKLVEEIDRSSERFYFVSDGGFFSEATMVAEKGYRVIVANLERSGATFEGDSRSLLNKEDFKEYNNITFTSIDNNGTLDDLYKTITEFSFDIVLNQVKEHYGGFENETDEYEVVQI